MVKAAIDGVTQGACRSDGFTGSFESWAFLTGSVRPTVMYKGKPQRHTARARARARVGYLRIFQRPFALFLAEPKGEEQP